MSKVFRILFAAVVLERIGPEEIAHGSVWGRLLEPVQATDVVEGAQLRREATVHAQELLVHEGGERQAVERVHARIVHTLRVLDLALLLEGEVLCEVTALVVAAQQIERARIQDLHRPQIQNTLFFAQRKQKKLSSILTVCLFFY
jgi:hypothetical protein